MDMENLNKSQIILLTLLVSFVTSIATGIVTVTLLDQAPPGVTQTINRVVEKTIETVMPGENQVTTVVKEVVVREEDFIASAVEKSSKGIVEIKSVDGAGEKLPVSLGVIISKDGYVVTDKKRLADNKTNLVIKYNDVFFKADVVSSNEDFFALLKISTTTIKEANKTDAVAENTSEKKENVWANDIFKDVIKTKTKDSDALVFETVPLVGFETARLGQTVIMFDGDAGDTVSVGIISSIKRVETPKDTDNQNADTKENESTAPVSVDYIVTDNTVSIENAGGPVVNTDGEIMGINVVSQDGSIIAIPSTRASEALSRILNPEPNKTKTNN